MTDTYAQIWEYAWYTWEKGPGFHNQIDLSSELSSTVKSSSTVAWDGKWCNHLEKQLDTLS